MEKNGTKVNPIPENETLWQKARRYGGTAVNWGKTHWKGLALGAVAIGGGAYMLGRRNGCSNDCETGPVAATPSDSADYREAIDRVFSGGGGEEPDGSDIGPTEDDDEIE